MKEVLPWGYLLINKYFLGSMLFNIHSNCKTNSYLLTKEKKMKHAEVKLYVSHREVIRTQVGLNIWLLRACLEPTN